MARVARRSAFQFFLASVQAAWDASWVARFRGGLVAALLPPLFALVQFTTLWQPVALFAGLQVVFFVVGSILLPRMQRDGLNIDPVVVLLSLAFWGAIWGVPGMFLSTPLTVTGIIILAQFDTSRWLAILLSGDGAPQGAARAPPRVLL